MQLHKVFQPQMSMYTFVQYTVVYINKSEIHKFTLIVIENKYRNLHSQKP